MSKDQMYGGLILLVSIVIAIAFLAAFFAPHLALPDWLSWWAVAIPVFLFVLGVLVIGMWIGWTMLTTPPPAPLETEMPSARAKTGESAEDKS